MKFPDSGFSGCFDKQKAVIIVVFYATSILGAGLWIASVCAVLHRGQRDLDRLRREMNANAGN